MHARLHAWWLAPRASCSLSRDCNVALRAMAHLGEWQLNATEMALLDAINLDGQVHTPS